jgi:hypothetical protein
MNGCGDFQPVLGIPIENEEARGRIKRERLPQLLNNPKARGMPRDVAVQNTSAIMADDEEAVEHGEGDRGNREEVHRGDGFPMVTQKSEPTLGRVWISGGSFHPAGNRSFGNVETEHEKFSVDAGSSPAGILGHHLEDEIPNLFRCLSSTDGFPGLRNHPPVPTEPGAVPTDHGFGCDDEECLFPT